MAVINLDFSAATDELVPEGDYSVMVEKVEARPPGPSSKTGKPTLNWTLQITEGDFRNRKVWLTTPMAEGGLRILKDALEAVGAYQEGMSIETEDTSNLVVRPQLSGRPAIATIEHREWDGKKRTGVKRLKKMNGASPNGGSPFR